MGKEAFRLNAGGIFRIARLYKKEVKIMAAEKEDARGFCLMSHEAKEIDLKDFRGKWLVLYFYPKDNTPGCTTEAKEFSALKPRFEKLNAEIAGVSADSAESHNKFREKHNLSITLLSDPSHDAISEYGAWRNKMNFGISTLGIVRSTTLIDPEGKVAYKWEKVKAAGHAEEVLNKLIELQKAGPIK